MDIRELTIAEIRTLIESMRATAPDWCNRLERALAAPAN